jgi:hypothetical protein
VLAFSSIAAAPSGLQFSNERQMSEFIGTMFDGMMAMDDNEEEEEKDTLEDQKLSFCIRKYVVDRGMIDTDVHNVNLNPDKIVTDGIDCEDKITPLRDSFYKKIHDGTPEIMRACVMRQMKSLKTFEDQLKYPILKELKLTSDQMKPIRKKFVEYTMETIHRKKQCV